MKDDMDYEIQNVAKFFVGRSIFITGSTGFVGKVLVEKLLRSCPEIDKLYLLVREKKGVPIEERLKNMFSQPLYDKLHETNPSVFKKVIPIIGDLVQTDLGINPIDRQILIDNVSIIINNAANVRFDDSLKHAILNNTRSIRDICILGESMKKLVALLHISSTYAHCDIPVVHEIPYKAEIDWRDAIKIAENVDDYLLKILTSKYIGTCPNTYIFSKKLAEDVINYYSDRLPCVICRPSIIISSVEDPISGWLENFNGPIGLMIASGKGILHICYGNLNKSMDFVPVDVTVKIFILAIYMRGQKTVEQYPTPMVYNVATYNLKKVTLEYLIIASFKINNVNPLSNPIRYPHITVFSNFFLFYIQFILFQLLWAMVIDLILKLIGRKTTLVKLQRKIYISCVFLFYFINNSWEFRNEKSIRLLNSVIGKDKSDFWTDIHNLIPEDVLTRGLIGAKKYLLKEDMNVENNKRALRRIWYYNILVKAICYIFCLWFILSYILKWI